MVVDVTRWVVPNYTTVKVYICQQIRNSIKLIFRYFIIVCFPSMNNFTRTEAFFTKIGRIMCQVNVLISLLPGTALSHHRIVVR